ncbi:MAG: hypothetical protein HY367_02910 [Candidatus Aenigmarchaeota archaeon]|nr:hypothetical protein [Candidatus Aenigmarchaeota archaeon]
MATIYKKLGYALIGFSVVLLAVLSFAKAEVDTQAAFLCNNLHDTQSDILACPVHTSPVSWLFVAAFGVSFLMLGAGIYMGFIYKLPPAADMRRTPKEIDASRLDTDETRVYETLKSKEGSAYQTDLIKETGFSKVKVTRVLDKLEAKDILERKRRGMANIIVLK